MIRGQLCLYGTTPDRDGWGPAGGVGIVEAPVGVLIPERIVPFVGTCFGTGHLLVPSAYSRRPVEDAGHELADHVRTAQWPRPAAGSGVPGGGMMFRRTRVPAAPDREIMTVAICMHVPMEAVASQARYSLSGIADGPGMPPRISLHSPEICAPLAENGIGMTALLKRAAWGWDDEPFALQSTMRLDIIDEAMECSRLLDKEDPTAEDDARLASLRHGHGYGVVAHNRTGYDADAFAAYRRLMRDSTEHDDWSRPLTAGQMEERRCRTEAAVRQILGRSA
jgi:hypothetical protein